jgi:hypothetical protein
VVLLPPDDDLHAARVVAQGGDESRDNQGNLPNHQGFPTKVVTLCAAKLAEKRPPETVMAVPAASLELADVTYGVTDAGHAEPETKKDTFWAPPPFTTTMATVPSAGLANATTRGVDPEGVGAPVTPTR